jgi:hypothetical protein
MTVVEVCPNGQSCRSRIWNSPNQSLLREADVDALVNGVPSEPGFGQIE